MKVMKCLMFLFALFFSTIVSGQRESDSERKNYEMVSFGVGLGLDYGGRGINLTTFLAKPIGVFGGVGITSHFLAYNVGVKLRLMSEDDNVFSLVALGMYGYNAAFNQGDFSGRSNGHVEVGNGITVGPGFDLRAFKGGLIFSLAVLKPIYVVDKPGYSMLPDTLFSFGLKTRIGG